MTSSSTPASIKLNITKMAEETMKHINTLTAMAFGENKNSAPSSEVDTLTSLLLDSLRQSIKLYGKYSDT